MNDRGYMPISKSVEWATPKWLFDELNLEFGFTIDVCASEDNAKCDRYFSIKDNGLEQSWKNERVWMNPPYGSEITAWIKKAHYQQHKAKLIVALLPAKTSTKWFHAYIYNKTELRFLEGRLKFSNSGSAPFGSMIVIWHNASKS